MAEQHPYGHDFSDARPGDQGTQQNLLHAVRGGVMGGNEYRVQNMPRACIYRTAAASPGSGANGLFAFDTVDYDTDSMVSITANPSRLTVRTSGIYLVVADIAWAGNNVGWRRLWISKTTPAAVQTLYADDVRIDPTTIGCWTHAVAQVAATAGDYFEAQYFQNSGGLLAIAVSSATNRENGLSACMISTL